MTTDNIMPDLPKGVTLVDCGKTKSGRKWWCSLYRSDDPLDLPRWQGVGRSIPAALRDALRDVDPGTIEISIGFEVYE